VQPEHQNELRKIGSVGLPIRTRALEMTYGEEEPKVRALRSLDLAIPGGQFLVVRGRSGSGKSTLFHLLAGMKKPTSGSVMVGDTEVNSLTEAESARFRRHKIGLVYQFQSGPDARRNREHRAATPAGRSPAHRCPPA
jgi:putative ABC transport system ATP-binding protein